MIKISVIIPVYNASRYLRRCLDSLCTQSYGCFEILCVDDGSADDSLDVLQHYAAQDSRVKVIHQANEGASAARNRALEEVQGDVVGFCDADDTYHPEALANIAKIFSNNECDVLVTAYEVAKADGSRHRLGREAEYEYSARELQERIMYDSCVRGFTWNKFFKAHLLEGVSFDEHLSHCEDMYFVSQVLKRNPEIKVLQSPVCTYAYFDNRDSVTRDPQKLLNEEGELMYVVAMEKMRELYSDDSLMNQLIRATSFRLIAENIKSFADSPETARALAAQAMEFARDYLSCGLSEYSFIKRLRRCLRLRRHL